MESLTQFLGRANGRPDAGRDARALSDRSSLRRLVAALTIGLIVTSVAPARAADHLTGVVLMAPSPQQVVVHHAPFAGMPSMTMTFALKPATQLHPGDRISADADLSSDPWTLSHVRIVGSEVPPAQPRAAPFVKVGDLAPGGEFLDQAGRPFSLASLRRAPYALSFIYTRCADPTMCPLISAKFRRIQSATNKPIALVEISLDPAYDRPPVLARYAAAYGADATRWHLLTGDPRKVLDFAARFGILEHSAGPVTIVHSERLAVVDRTGRVTALFNGAGWSPNDISQALQRARS